MLIRRAIAYKRANGIELSNIIYLTSRHFVLYFPCRKSWRPWCQLTRKKPRSGKSSWKIPTCHLGRPRTSYFWLGQSVNWTPGFVCGLSHSISPPVRRLDRYLCRCGYVKGQLLQYMVKVKAAYWWNDNSSTKSAYFSWQPNTVQLNWSSNRV